MANSYIDYTGNGSLTTFTTPPYLDEAHLVVSVDGVIKTLTTDYTVIAGSTSLVFTTAPTTSARIRISRNSSQALRITDYSNASLLTADVLDADANQLFYMAQEAADVASETNLAAGTFYYSQGTAPSEVLGNLWYDISGGVKVLKVWDGTEWQATAPAHETKVYSRLAIPAEGVLGTSYSSYIMAGGLTELRSLTNTSFNSSASIYLNGVKLIAGTSVEQVINGTADYYHNSLGQVYFLPLVATDRMVVEIYSGSFSSSVTQSEVNAAASAQTASAAAAQVAAIDVDSLVTAASQASDVPALAATATAAKEDAVKLAVEPEDSTYTLSDGTTTGNSALHYAAKAEASATTALGAAYGVTLGTPQTISGIKTFSAQQNFTSIINASSTVNLSGAVFTNYFQYNSPNWGAANKNLDVPTDPTVTSSKFRMTNTGAFYTGTNASTQFSIKNVGTSTNASPDLLLENARTDATTGAFVAADGAGIGGIYFKAYNDVGASQTFAHFYAKTKTVADGAESGEIQLNVMKAGAVSAPAMTFNNEQNTSNVPFSITGTCDADDYVINNGSTNSGLTKSIRLGSKDTGKGLDVNGDGFRCTYIFTTDAKTVILDKGTVGVEVDAADLKLPKAGSTITLTSPDGNTTKTLSLDNSGNLLLNNTIIS